MKYSQLEIHVPWHNWHMCSQSGVRKLVGILLLWSSEAKWPKLSRTLVTNVTAAWWPRRLLEGVLLGCSSITPAVSCRGQHPYPRSWSIARGRIVLCQALACSVLDHWTLILLFKRFLACLKGTSYLDRARIFKSNSRAFFEQLHADSSFDALASHEMTPDPFAQVCL